METLHDRKSGIDYHEIAPADLEVGDEILPWDFSDIEQTGTYKVTEWPVKDGGSMVIVTDRGGRQERALSSLVRIRARANTGTE